MSKATARPEPEMADHRVVDLGVSGIGVHPVGGFGVPHDGCKCGTCLDARARAQWPSERAELIAALREAALQLEYLNFKHPRHGTTEAVIARLRDAIAKVEERR